MIKKLIIFIIFGSIFMAVYYWFYGSYHHGYKIIYLNGPSSAGKSTLARALQQKLEKPFLVIGIDQIIFMMPDKLNDWQNETMTLGFSWQPVKDAAGNVTAYKIHKGPFGKRMCQAFKDIAVTLASSGNYVIIDDVSFGKKEVDEWRRALKKFKVLWVGVTAPIEIIEAREKERGDRKLGSARWQVERVHSSVDYDVMINTHKKSMDDNIKSIADSIEK